MERDKNIRMNEDQEIRQLAAEKLAIETLLVELLSRFDDHDANLTATIKDALDQATRFLEDRTSDVAEFASSEQIAHSLRVIDELRIATHLVPCQFENGHPTKITISFFDQECRCRPTNWFNPR